MRLVPALAGIALLALTATALMTSQATAAPKPGPALAFKVKDIDGKPVDLAHFQGKVVMYVNVASYCGNTKQYTSLQAMYEKYKDKGLVILGFPANDFGMQEPDAEGKIKEFCSTKYHVTFPMFSKIVVKGEGQDPLYKYLTEATGKPIEWNFAKILVNRKGEVAGRFPAGTDPLTPDVVAAVEKELGAK